MSKADQYRDRAHHCMMLAERSTHPEDKASWLGLARAWLDLIEPRHEQPPDGIGPADKA